MAEKKFQPVELVKDGAPTVTAHSKAELNKWVYSWGYTPKAEKPAKKADQ